MCIFQQVLSLVVVVAAAGMRLHHFVLALFDIRHDVRVALRILWRTRTLIGQRNVCVRLRWATADVVRA